MFRKVRKKFVIVAVCSVFIVMLCILGTINIVNYTKVVNNADEIIDILKEGNGEFGNFPGQDFSPEMPFSTRYFTVTLAPDGKVVRMNLNKIVSVSVEEAASYATELFAKGKANGFYGNFRYGVLSMHTGETMYLFVDCFVELESFNNFLLASIVIGSVGVAVVFVLVFIFSGRIMKPVAESYRKQKQFITDAGHEIKTPLTVIGANTELIEMLSGESEWTKGIKEQIQRLKNLTEKLIFLAKTEEQTNISMFEFSLTDAVRETIQSFAAVAASRNISLTTDIQNDLCYIGNEEMIRQLVSLLTDNALKYTDGDTVAVTLRAENGKRILETRNRASYMRDGSLNGVFERFARGDSSRNSQTGGQGIGLSVSKAIVEAHKGKIKGECRSGIVTFTVIL